MGKEINVLYFEQLPWFVKPLLHTMKTEVIEDEFGEYLPRFRRMITQCDPIFIIFMLIDPTS